jgi:hypothetical protein
VRVGFYDIDTRPIVNFQISLNYPLLSRQVYLDSFSLMSEYGYGDGVVGYVTSFFLLHSLLLGDGVGIHSNLRFGLLEIPGIPVIVYIYLLGSLDHDTLNG